jgi:hypothetical protein
MGCDPTPVNIDTKEFELSKRKAVASMKLSASVKAAAPATDLGGLATKKMYAPGATDYVKVFAEKHGQTMLQQVLELYARHFMVNPLAHPPEPYIKCWEETWDPLTESRDPDGEKMLEKLATELRAKKCKFEDPTFPADDSSLFSDPSKGGANASAEQTFRKDQDPFLAGVSGISWKRPDEWGVPGQKCVVWSGGVDPDDVAQGRLGNCYFLAAMAGCALGDQDVSMLDSNGDS